MKQFLDSSLLGEMARALDKSLADVEEARFPCRPLAARSAGGATALGRFKGPIGLVNRAEFKDALRDLGRDSPQKIILDLAEASLSKSAVGMLLGFAAVGVGKNKRLYLYRPSAQIRAVLRELGLDKFFSCLDTEDDVIATLVI